MYQQSNFIWNDKISGDELGLKIVKITTDSFKESFIAPRTINKSRTINGRYNYRTYLFNVEAENMTFTMDFLSETALTKENLDYLSSLFILPNYANLYVLDNERNYNCICTNGDLNCYLNSFVISLSFECSSPFSHSSWFTTTFSSTSTITKPIINTGATPIKPILKIQPLTTGGTIKITNLSNSGKYIEFVTDSKNNQLNVGETIETNFATGKIKTDSLGQYRYDNLTSSSEFFDLIVGNNDIQITGNCIVQVLYRFAYFA